MMISPEEALKQIQIGETINIHEQIVSKLKKGLFQRIGPDKGGYWRVTKED